MGHTDALQEFSVAQMAEEFDDTSIAPKRIIQSADGDEAMKRTSGKSLTNQFHLIFHLSNAAPHHVDTPAKQMHTGVFGQRKKRGEVGFLVDMDEEGRVFGQTFHQSGQMNGIGMGRNEKGKGHRFLIF